MLPQLDLSCSKDEMRPIMNYICVNKEFTVSTDAHVMTVFRTKDVFHQDFIEHLPKKNILIHREDWAKIKKADILELKISKESKVIEAYFDKKRNVLVKVENENEVANYPQWKNVIPTDNNTSRNKLDFIGVNANLLAIVQKILDNAVGMKLEFFEKNKAIICKSLNQDVKGYCIVMPVMVDELSENVDTFI